MLPFADMSAQKDQEYFSDGLAEELLNSLAKIPGLRVAARTSSFQFKGKNEDLRTIGEKLNVSTILEGSVRKQGERVRITAQLIKASDGFQSLVGNLRSPRADATSSRCRMTSRERSRGRCRSRCSGAARQRPPRKGTNVEAYNAVLQGRYFLSRRSKENHERALGYFEQAIKLDPTLRSAWAGLAGARHGAGGCG